MEVSLPIQTTFFWEITLIEEGRAFKPSVYCMHTRLSIQRKSIFLEEITSRHPLPGYMVFTKNVIVFLFKYQGSGLSCLFNSKEHGGITQITW